MALLKYYSQSGDIVLGNFFVQMDCGFGVTGCFILSNREDTGSGWKYTARFGYKTSNVSGNVTANYGGANGRIVVAGVDSGTWDGGNFGNCDLNPYSYYMFGNTSSVTVPYGASVSGTVTCTAYNMYQNPNWTYGGNVTNGNFDQGSFEPSPVPPIPPVPTLSVDAPTRLTATSVYLSASIYGSKATLDYYHMGLWDRISNTWKDSNVGGVRYSDRIQYTHTYEGLTPETEYRWEVFVEDSGLTDPSYIKSNFYFRTLSWAKLALKVSNTWRTGITYIKVGGAWRRGKQVFIKQNGVWRRSKDQ